MSQLLQLQDLGHALHLYLGRGDTPGILFRPIQVTSLFLSRLYLCL